MSLKKIEELKADIEDLRSLLTLAKRQKVKDVLSIELRKSETELISMQAVQESEPGSGVRPTSSAPKYYECKLTNYAWDQSDKFVKIFVTLKNVQSLEPELVTCKFSSRSMELHVKGLDSKHYILTIKNLLENIDDSKSHWKVKTDMVVLFLAKATSSKHWAHLIAGEMKTKEPKVPSLDPDEDPSTSLMNLMRKMYEDGDDEMKRTIAKAWTENRERNMNV